MSSLLVFDPLKPLKLKAVSLDNRGQLFVIIIDLLETQCKITSFF